MSIDPTPSIFGIREWKQFVIGLIIVFLIVSGVFAFWLRSDWQYPMSAIIENSTLVLLLLLPILTCFLCFRKWKRWLFPLCIPLTWILFFFASSLNQYIQHIQSIGPRLEEVGYMMIPVVIISLPVILVWSVVTAAILFKRREHLLIASFNVLLILASLPLLKLIGDLF